MNEKVDELVFAYQRGEEGAAEALIDLFAGDDRRSQFIGKYIRLLKYEVFDLMDKDTRRFLQLYIGEGRESLMNRYQSAEGKALAAKTAGMLSKALITYEEEDLVQDLLMLLLVQAGRYKKQKEQVNFGGYLYNSFRFTVFNHLKKHAFRFDVLNHPKKEELSEDIMGEQGIEPKEEWFQCHEGMFGDAEELGLDWLTGDSNHAFGALSQLERLILRLSYEDGKTDSEIAEQLGFHRNTVLKYRHQAKENLQAAIDRLKEEDLFY